MYDLPPGPYRLRLNFKEKDGKPKPRKTLREKYKRHNDAIERAGKFIEINPDLVKVEILDFNRNVLLSAVPKLPVTE